MGDDRTPEGKRLDAERAARGHQTLGLLGSKNARALRGNLPSFDEDGQPLNRAARRLKKRGKL